MRGILGLVIVVLMLPVVVFGGQRAVEFLSHAAAVPANIVVDFSNFQGELSRPWVGLAQGGEQERPGELVNLSLVTGAVKSLGVRYLRIDHVLEDAFYPNLRNRVAEIISSGAVPIIALSYFPKDAATSDVGTVTNWPVWESRVKELVETVSGRNGLNLSGVYYEVWNEPDGPTFGNVSVDTYNQLYQRTLSAVLSAQNVNGFKIGGPALADLRRCTNGALFICRQFWLDRFLTFVAQNNLRLDFISWHRYSLRLSDYQEDTNFILNLLTKHPGLKSPEKIITEWGSDPARAKVHNTVFDAAHLVAAARSFVGYVNLATKFEVRDGPDYPDSGWGILAHDGSKKPTFTALGLLNRLRRDRVLLTGEGTYVSGIASRDNSGATVILSNYDRYASNTEKVPVKIVNLIPGTYQLTKYTLDKQKTERVIINGSYQTTELLLPNSVILWDFQLVQLPP